MHKKLEKITQIIIFGLIFLNAKSSKKISIKNAQKIEEIKIER